MRKLLTSLLVVALVLSGCGAGDDGTGSETTDKPGTTEPQEVSGDDGGDAEDTSDDQPVESSTSDSDSNSEESSDEDSDEPIPEGSGPLPPDSIRIGDEVFERMSGASLSGCFVQEGVPPFSINGALDDDDRFRFNVDYVEEGVFEASISNEDIFWVAAPMRDGTELSVEWDVDTQTISGSGLFNDAFQGLWAYGSFQFTCSDE